MITIRPLSTHGTMTRQALALNLQLPPPQKVIQAVTTLAKPVKNLSFADKFHHNLETVGKLPDTVAMECGRLIYGPVYGFAQDVPKTPKIAREALGNLVSSTTDVARKCRDIVNAQARKANLAGVELLELI